MSLIRYALIEQNRLLLAPMAAMLQDGADTLETICEHGVCMPGWRRAQASAELTSRLVRHYQRPAFGIHSVETAHGTARIEEREALRLPFCTLRHFAKSGVEKTGTPVLLFAPLSGHYATLLRETVSQFLVDHDVWITDWTNAQDVPFWLGDFGFDDYVRYAQTFMDHLPDAAVVCVCQPAVPVLAAASLRAAHTGREPCAIVLMAGPIDTRINPTEVNEYAASHSLAWFAANVIDIVCPPFMGAGRAVYPSYLQHAGFVSMNLDRHVKSHVEFFESLTRGDDAKASAHRRFYDEYNAVMDLPARYYHETLARVFIDQRLAKGCLTVGGASVTPSSLKRTHLLCVEAELDDICGRGQTMAALDLATGLPTSHKHSHLVPGAGHYGVFSGTRFRQHCYPTIARFIESASARPRMPEPAAA